MEKRGLPTRNGLVFDYSTVASGDNRTLAIVTILPADFPDALCIAKAKSYVTTAAILPLPDNRIVLWRERDHLVLAVTRGGDPVYAQVLVRHTQDFRFTDQVVREIRNIQLALKMEQVIDSIAGVTLWGEWPRGVDALKLLHLPVNTAPRPAPAAERILAATTRSTLLPLPLQAARVTLSKRDRNLRLAIIAVAGYLALILLLAIYTHSVQARAAKLMVSVNRDKPVADTLEKTVASWRAMEPAIDPKLYAIEQFYQCASVLPGAGVRFDTFETQGTTIKINGIARNAPTVFRFVDRLKKNKALSDYQWKMGQPKLQKDDTAEFKIEGTLRYGPAK